MTGDSSPPGVRFGDFEVDLRSGELRKRGVRVPLQGRAFQVLEALLRTPGELVTRETLRQQLWSSDTFVDFEHGLNAAVRRLREALGDAADVPRFVETLPRRGYRFVAPVHERERPASAAAPAATPPVEAAAHPAPARQDGRWRRVGPPLAGGAALILAIGALVALVVRRGDVPPAAPRIVPLTTTAGSEVTPTLSPDGTQVAFSWNGERPQGGGDPDIWLATMGGADLRRLTTGPDADVSPSWSPDGHQIAFLRMAPDSPPDAEAGIFVMSALGSAVRRVGTAPALASQLSWSADGRFVAAMTRRTGASGLPEAGGLQLIAVDAARSRPLTRPAASGYDMQPAFSADGRWLAHASCANRVTPPCDVHLVALGAGMTPVGTPRRLTHHRAAIHGIAWAPDGRSLVYGVSAMYFFGAGIGSQLWRVAIDGTRPPERIESSRSGSFAPATAAGPPRLVFAQDRGDFDILRFVPPDGESPVIVSSFVDYGPSFSPDGRRFAFESSRSGDAEEIYLADADGSNIVRLTGGAVDWRGEPRWRGNPVWSPDGKRIVFASRGDGGDPDLWTITIEGRSVERLTRDAFHDAIMTWSPDGQWVYYRQDRADGRDIVRIDARGGVPERVSRNGALYPVASTDGKTIFFSKTETRSPLFALTIGGDERQIVDCVRPRALAVAAGGLYYLGCGGERLSLYRRDLATGETRTLGTVKADGCCMGLTVSPDGKTILFGRTVTIGADLMLIEDFR